MLPNQILWVLFFDTLPHNKLMITTSHFQNSLQILHRHRPTAGSREEYVLHWLSAFGNRQVLIYLQPKILKINKDYINLYIYSELYIFLVWISTRTYFSAHYVFKDLKYEVSTNLQELIQKIATLFLVTSTLSIIMKLNASIVDSNNEYFHSVWAT